MSAVLTFLVVLAVLVFVHELGHFIAAKLIGARVDAFALGFPPKLIKKRVGETEYSLNLIPFGGYVSILGENPADEASRGKDDSRSLSRKNRAAQALVFSAGVIMNVAFAWILLSAGFVAGIPYSTDNARYSDKVQDPMLTVTYVVPDSPAAAAGIAPGDKILYVGQDGVGIEPSAPGEVAEYISPRAGKSLDMLISRADEPSRTVSVIPKEGLIEEVSPSAAPRAAIGIGMDTVGVLRLPVHLALIEGARTTYFMTDSLVRGIAGLIKDAVKGEADVSDVSGPIGIAGLINDARELGFEYLITFTAFISLNLAVLNLLPIPALDGGRILFVAIESVWRRPIPAKAAQYMNAAGFALMILLMIAVTVKDVVGLFR